jgi:methyl-accepting chemotaxis protein
VLGVSGKVLDVVEKGVSTVDEAMVRSEHANGVLDGILVAATQTGSLVRGIAGAMGEQSRGAQRVDQAMQNVHGTAIALRDIVAGQKRGGSELQTAMSRMRDLMGRALQTSKEQAEQVEGAIVSMGSVFEQIGRIGDMNEGQAGSRDEVARAFELLEQISARHLESARSLAAAVERAAAQSASLTESVEVFRV